MKVIGGSGSETLTVKVAKELGFSASRIETKRFPDGEKYLRVMDEMKGENVVVVQSMYKTPDEHLMEYFLLVDNLKELGAKRVVSFIPYFAYARQDARFNPGEALSLVTVSKLIQSVGTDEVYAFDAHMHRIAEMIHLFNVPARNLTAAPTLGEYVRDVLHPNDPLVIGPDEESESIVQDVAKVLDAEFDVLIKKRISAEKVEIRPRESNAKGHDVIMADDIISTGGTVVEALKILRAQGAHKVYVTCIHPLLIGNALAKVFDAGADAVIGTDTIPSPVSLVSVAPLIAAQVRKLGLN
jgi:ribose-phosphate pyrophosphokinase